MPEVKRDYTPREMRMVQEWIEATYPDRPYALNYRLGSIEPRLPDGTWSPDDLAAFSFNRRYVDGVVFHPDALELVEGSIKGGPNKVGQLELYSRLVGKTPELEEWWFKRLLMTLLVAVPDAAMELMAREKSMHVIVYKAPWLDSYLATLRPREATARQMP